MVFRSIRLFSLLMVMQGVVCAKFDTIDDLRKYADNHQQSPPADKDDLMDPDYTSYHNSLQSSFFNLFSFTGNDNIWTIDDFLSTLNIAVNQRNAMHLNNDTVAAMILDNEQQLFVWGDLSGAYHSLVRDLVWLFEHKIINNRLEVIKPHSMLIFNGNVIGGSPYVLEVLTLVMLLLIRNPEKVLYIRGENENHDFWRNYNLAREVKVRINKSYLDEQIILNQLSNFISTLPYALYLGSTKNNNFLQISSFGKQTLKINEKKMGDFWQKLMPGKIMYGGIAINELSNKEVNVVAIVKADKITKKSRTMVGEPKEANGLGLLDQDLGTVAWGILSSPTPIYQKYYTFHYDAFGLIDAKIPIEDSTISLYNQDMYAMDGFIKYGPWSIVSAIKAIKVEKGSFLNIGTSLSLCAGVPTLGKSVERGLSSCITRANFNNALNNTWLKLKVYNDDYIPYRARKNIIHLLEVDNTDIIVLPVGSPTINAYRDYMNNKKILVLFPVTGDPSLRTANLNGVIHLRASYGQEVEALISYVLAEYGVKKFAFFYQNDRYGLGALEVAHKVLKEKGISNWSDISYYRMDTNFADQIQLFKEAQPDVIAFFSTGQSTQEFINQLGVDNLVNKTIIGLSFLGDQMFRQFLKRIGLKVIFGAVVPNPLTSQLAIVKKYKQEMDVYSYNYDVASLEAYIGTMLLLEIIKKISPDITKENVQKSLEALNNYDFYGLKLTFDPLSRSFMSPVWIETDVDDEWLEFDNAKKVNKDSLNFNIPASSVITNLSNAVLRVN